MSINEIINAGVEVSLHVSAADLKEFALALLSEGRELERRAASEKPAQDREMSPAETARELGVSRSTLYVWEQKGYLLPSFRKGRKKVYRQSDIDAVIKHKTSNNII